MADLIGEDLVPGIRRHRIDIVAFFLDSFHDEIQGLLEVFIVLFEGEDILPFESGNGALSEFSPVFFGNGGSCKIPSLEDFCSHECTQERFLAGLLVLQEHLN